MQKAQRDNILSRLSQEDRQNFRRVLVEVKTQLKGSSNRRVPARQILEMCGDELNSELQQALQTIIARDESGPKVGEVPPDIDLKLLESENRVRLSSFRSQRPVALAFGSYT